MLCFFLCFVIIFRYLCFIRLILSPNDFKRKRIEWSQIHSFHCFGCIHNKMFFYLNFYSDQQSILVLVSNYFSLSHQHFSSYSNWVHWHPHYKIGLVIAIICIIYCYLPKSKIGNGNENFQYRLWKNWRWAFDCLREIESNFKPLKMSTNKIICHTKNNY